jgi:hypothetical protein
MNLPNKLTVLRIIMIPICLGLWALGQPVLSAAVFALAAITDFLDGYIARKQKIVTVFGKFADPVADKVLVLTAMIFLCADGRLPAWAVAIVAALTLFFKVQEIEVVGNVRYTGEEILEVAQIKPGDNLVLLDKYGISQRIYTRLPYVTNVSPRRKFPDKLIVEVTETRAVAAVEGGGSWWLLSSNGKILEPIERADAGDYMILAGVSAVEPTAAGWLETTGCATGCAETIGFSATTGCATGCAETAGFSATTGTATGSATG